MPTHRHDEAAARTRTVVPAVVCAALTGAVVAVQGRFNGDLSHAGTGIVVAGWLSYLGTVLSIALVIALLGRGPGTLALLRRKGRWWWFVVGLCSIPIVLSMAAGIPIVGVAIASVCAVAGQTIAGLGFDSRGIGLAAPLALTGRRVAAGVVAVLGLAVAVGGGSGGGASAWVVLGIGAALFVGGATLCVQHAGNGRVATIAGDPLVPGLTSSAGGAVGVTVILGVVALAGGLDGLTFPGTDQWYLYLGGPLGAVITVSSAWAVRHLGTFALTLAIIGGQMLMAMALDVTGPTGLAWPTMVAAVAVCVSLVLSMPQRARVPFGAGPTG